MDISGISSAASTYQTNQTNSSSGIRRQFQILAQSLQSGDLADAQTAFSTIQTDIQNSSSTQSPFSGNSQVSSDFQALATALQSGNLSSAQSAFATLQQDMQAMQQAGLTGDVHRHHHGGKFDSAMAQQMKDFNSLDQTLQSGDTSSAQSALTALLQDIQSSTDSFNPFTANSQASTDLQNVQSALQSGDISSAQTAFAELKQDIMPPPMNGNSQGISASSSVSQQSSVGNTVDVTA